MLTIDSSERLVMTFFLELETRIVTDLLVNNIFIKIMWNEQDKKVF